MASNMKKYILTAVTLGLIAAGSALLIAGANIVTKGPIGENEQKRINNGLVDIFDQTVLGEETDLISDKDIDYISVSYKVTDESNALIGYAFRTDGFNNYGKISLIIGFNTNCVYKGLSTIANEQSFATDLKKNYISLIENGNQTIEDVSVVCGATYGATLVRDMVTNAGKAAIALDAAIKGANNG